MNLASRSHPRVGQNGGGNENVPTGSIINDDDNDDEKMLQCRNSWSTMMEMDVESSDDEQMNHHESLPPLPLSGGMTWRNNHSNNLMAKKKDKNLARGMEHVVAEDVREQSRIRLLLENIIIRLYYSSVLL